MLWGNILFKAVAAASGIFRVSLDDFAIIDAAGGVSVGNGPDSARFEILPEDTALFARTLDKFISRIQLHLFRSSRLEMAFHGVPHQKLLLLQSQPR